MARKKTALPKSRAKTAYGLLSEVRKLILDEPLRYDQGQYLARQGTFGDPDRGFPSCGTVGCVAGRVVTLKGRPTSMFTYMTVEEDARRILGLDSSAAMDLFDGGAAKGASQTLRHARSGAAHIAQFQKEHAAQLKAKAV